MPEAVANPNKILDLGIDRFVIQEEEIGNHFRDGKRTQRENQRGYDGL
jgi:hypothetical protein